MSVCSNPQQHVAKYYDRLNKLLVFPIVIPIQTVKALSFHPNELKFWADTQKLI